MSKTDFGLKPRIEILDGLRGVAAVLVVAYHLLESYCGGDHTKQILNHGYLAADFFFVLSIFVSYATLKAYDLPVRAWLGKFNKSRMNV